MATSGSTDFLASRDDIIKAAYRLVLADEDFTLTNNQTTNASFLLNMILKAWNVSLQIPLWALAYGYIAPTTNTSGFALPATGNVTSALGGTVLAADSAANDTTIEVSFASSSILDTYAIGVELDGGDMHWTTVSGSPVGDVVTLTAGLSAAASSGNFVWFYSTDDRAPAAIRILDASRLDYYEINDTLEYNTTSLDVITNTEFLYEISNLSIDGKPLKLSYEPLVSSNNIRIWPQFQDGKSLIRYRYLRTLEDFDSSADNPDFPVAWTMPMVYELAIALAPTYQVSDTKVAMLKQERKRWLDEIGAGDYEEGSIFLYPTGGIENGS